MRFAILEEMEQNSPPPKPELESEDNPIKTPKPITKIPYEILKSIIDKTGSRLACDEEMSIERKVDEWVEFLKWAITHIPADEQHAKAQMKESINNPCQWDFMERPQR